MKKRVTGKRHLLLTADFPPRQGGVSVYFFNLWKRLPGEAVAVVAPDVRGAEEIDGKESFRTHRKRLLAVESKVGRIARPLLFWVYSLSLLKKEGIGFIHCAELLPTALTGFFLNIFHKVPYYVYMTGSEFRGYGRSFFLRNYMRISLRRAAKVIAISDFTRQEVIQRTGLKGEKVVTVTPGVDAETFKPLAKNQDLLQQYHLEGKQVILTVSRLDENKGHDKVIEALPLILKEIPNAVYLVVGSGPTEQRLKGLAQTLGLQDKVLFAGYAPDEVLPALYNLCDVFVLATREIERWGWIEGFGIVFLEASACGKPVVAGRTGGAVEAVLDQETGLLVDPLNIEEIAAATVRLLQDHALASRLGSQGRKRVLDHFTWEERAEKIGQLLGFPPFR